MKGCVQNIYNGLNIFSRFKIHKHINMILDFVKKKNRVNFHRSIRHKGTGNMISNIIAKL